MNNIITIPQPSLEKDLLSLMESHNISLQDVSHSLNEMTQREKYLAMHTTPITENAKSGRWITRLPNGEQVALNKKEKVEDRVVEYFQSLASRQAVRTLTTIYPEFMEANGDLAGGTLSKYSRYWTAFFEGATIASVPLNELSTSRMKTHLTTIIKRNQMKKRYFKNVLSFLNCMMEFARESDYIEINKVPRCTSFKKVFLAMDNDLENTSAVEMQTSDGSAKDALSKQQLELLLNVAEEDFTNRGNPASLGICILSMTGLRDGELCGLRFSDFDLENKLLYVRRMQKTKFKENAITKIDGYEIVNHLKSESSVRTLDVPQQVVDYVRIIQNRNKELGFPHKDTDYIFWRNNHNTNHQTVMCNNRVFDTLIRNYSKACNFDYTYSPHDLRRTYATLLYLDGTPLKDIQTRLGHCSEEMTLKYIRCISTDEEKSAYTERTFGRYQSKLV